MVLTRSEKENAIIELLKQSKSYTQIEQQLRVSSRDIASTKKRYEEEQKKVEEQQNKVQSSKSSQALSLFEQGTTPVQVAIELDVELSEVDRIYEDFSESNGLYDFNQIYAEIKRNGSISPFVNLYQITKNEGMTSQRVVNLLKIAEEIPNLVAESQRIEDCIDMDAPKISELKRQKVSLSEELKFMLEEVQSFRKHVESEREHTDNKLKSMQEELETAREHTNIELNIQKGSLVHELDKYKEYTINEINNSKECLLAPGDAHNQVKFIQKEVDKLKQEEQELTNRIERLKNEKRQEIFVQLAQSQAQLVQQERPDLLEKELRRIPVICYNWERKWEELMHHGLHDRKSIS